VVTGAVCIGGGFAGVAGISSSTLHEF